jgi:dTDP-glucose pyrophosphorylase
MRKDTDMIAGIPGTGIGGFFYMITALWMPVREVGLRVRKRDHPGRWRLVGVQLGIAAGIIAGAWLTGWFLVLMFPALVARAQHGSSHARYVRNVLTMAPILLQAATFSLVVLAVKIITLLDGRRRGESSSTGKPAPITVQVAWRPEAAAPETHLVSAPGGLPAVILAAGRGTRMATDEPKALVKVDGRPMVTRVIDAVRGGGATRVIVVVGHRGDEVKAAIGDGVEFAVQGEPLGTGHAVCSAIPVLDGFAGPLIVAHADIPLLRESDVTRLVEHHLRTGAAATLLAAMCDDPRALGRVLRGPQGEVTRIVEARDATPEELSVREVNVAVYCFDSSLLFEALTEVRAENAQRQYYLTDVIGILVARQVRVEAVTLESAHTGMGVDTLADLVRARSVSAAYEFSGGAAGN